MTASLGEHLKPLGFLCMWFALTFAMAMLATRPTWSSSGLRRRLYLLASWSLVTIGAVQIVFTPWRFSTFDEGALWFVTAGLAIILTGAINLLNLRNPLGDPWLRRTCFAANVSVTLVFVAIATHRGAEPPHDLVSLGLMTVGVVTTIASGPLGGLSK